MNHRAWLTLAQAHISVSELDAARDNITSFDDLLDELGLTHDELRDNFIVRLRKYFEDNPAQPKHFLTVRGRGYRFVREPEQR